MKYEKPKEEVRERTTKNENETKKIENENEGNVKVWPTRLYLLQARTRYVPKKWSRRSVRTLPLFPCRLLLQPSRPPLLPSQR